MLFALLVGGGAGVVSFGQTNVYIYTLNGLGRTWEDLVRGGRGGGVRTFSLGSLVCTAGKLSKTPAGVLAMGHVLNS